MSEPKKLLEQVRDVLRIKQYSYRTEQTYVDWIKRYIIFHNKRHPKDVSIQHPLQKGWPGTFGSRIPDG